MLHPSLERRGNKASAQDWMADHIAVTDFEIEGYDGQSSWNKREDVW
jgi:hypothetical protein